MNSKLTHTLPWASEAITTVAFIGNDKVIAGNKRGDILVWDLSAPEGKTPNPVRHLAGHTNEVNRILVTPDSKTLISVSSDRTVRYWDAQSADGEPGKVVLNGIARPGVIQLNAKPPKTPEPIEVSVVVQKPTRELTGHEEWVYGLSQTPDGKTLVTGDDKGVVIVWDLPSGKERRRWQAKHWARALGISPDGKMVALSEYMCFRHPEKEKTSYRAFRLWEVETGEPKVDLSEDIKRTMAAVVYSADGKWLAVAAGAGGEPEPKGIVTLLDPTTGKKIRELDPHHELGATDLAFHPDGEHLFTAGRDQHVKIWQIKDGKHLMDLGTAKKRGNWISGISISPDGRLLAAADMSGKILIYALTSVDASEEVAPQMKLWTTTTGLALLLCSANVMLARTASDVSKVIRPFVQKHCAHCHGAKKQKAELSFDVFRDETSIVKARKTWMRAMRMLQAGEMPPEDRPRPDGDEVAVFTTAVRDVFERYDSTAGPDPGRAPIRRLNRTEYGNTVRDLLQLDRSILLATDFPVDAVTHGFDNNADALTISPVLLDRYLAFAEMIAHRAILTKMPERKVVSATSRSLQPNQPGWRGGFRLLDSASAERHFRGPLRSPAPNGAGARASLLQFAATDDFIFRAIVYAETDSNNPVRASIFVTGPGLPEYSADDEIETLMGDVKHRDLQPMKILKTFEITSRSKDQPQRVEVLVTRRGREGPIANIGIALVKPAEDQPPVKLYVKLEAEGPLPLRSHTFLMESTKDKPQAERTREIIGRLLPRAFRRPVTKEEIEAVARFTDQAVADGLQWEVGIRRA